MSSVANVRLKQILTSCGAEARFFEEDEEEEEEGGVERAYTHENS